MVNVQIVSIILNFLLAIAAAVFAKEYKKFKHMYIQTAGAIKDDKVTWDEAQEIVEELGG